MPSGIIQFSVRYRFQGKQKRLKLGAYPAITLQAARKRARNAQAAIDDGHDPAGERRDPLCPISAPLAALLKVRLLTAQRGGEVTRMRWVDLDLESGWWTIPATDTKNGEPHRVPPSDEIVALIRAQQKNDRDREYVFVGLGASLRDRAKKAPSAIARALGIEFRGHDLRRTAATRIAQAGIPREHIAKVLNHVEGGPRATRVYDRHTYDREKRLAIDTWTRTLKSIIENTDAGKVLPLARGPGKASA